MSVGRCPIMRKKLPWILVGHRTYVRNKLLKTYSLMQLLDDETWYSEVIEAPEREFLGIHNDDLISIYEYFSPTTSDLIEIEEKYGNSEIFTVVIAKMIEIYELSYQSAVNKLEASQPDYRQDF